MFVVCVCVFVTRSGVIFVPLQTDHLRVGVYCIVVLVNGCDRWMLYEILCGTLDA